jgi:hypothetical protein
MEGFTGHVGTMCSTENGGKRFVIPVFFFSVVSAFLFARIFRVMKRAVACPGAPFPGMHFVHAFCPGMHPGQVCTR